MPADICIPGNTYPAVKFTEQELTDFYDGQTNETSRVRHESRPGSDFASRKGGSAPVVSNDIDIGIEPSEFARGVEYQHRVMSAPSGLWSGPNSSTAESSSPPSQALQYQDSNSIPEPELRMRRLMLQAENRQLSRSPQTISPLSPLRNPTPGLDAPFWNSNPTLFHCTTRYLNKSDRYRGAAMSESRCGCEDQHRCLAIDGECSYCRACRRDGLRKRLLARRSQASLTVPPANGGGKVGVVDNDEDLFGVL